LSHNLAAARKRRCDPFEAIDSAGVPVTEVKLFSHGTVGTNALITRRFARTSLVTTKGFRDVLEIRRSTKPDLWDAYKDVALLTSHPSSRPLEIARILGRRGSSPSRSASSTPTSTARTSGG
jgi:N-methylhydantoinase A/oxoprolinase/acetone carboxylase beta subunit